MLKNIGEEVCPYLSFSDNYFKKQERKRKKSAEKISKLARILLYIKVRFRSRDSLIKRRYRDLRKKKGENKYE